ncbi:hypothetical protein DM992_39625 (plasmid) [Burkholderia sp. JP2-270]|nr:hypothetical protein DM992_39625 [Burkholderia sp. JP2-270]
MPAGVDSNELQASLRKGVLTIMLPKWSEAREARTKTEVRAD